MTDPSTCWICTRHAVGIGLGFTNNRDKDPRWICQECVLDIERLRLARRPTVYELKAREGGMDAAASLIEEFGPDLSEYTEEQALMLCGAIWKGCADRLRHLVAEGEAPW